MTRGSSKTEGNEKAHALAKMGADKDRKCKKREMASKRHAR